MTVVAVLFDALAHGLLLFMMAAGLTLVFGLLRVLSFAQGGFYLLGAYAAHAVAPRLGFAAALLVAPVLVAALAALVERFGLRRLHGTGPTGPMLLTFALACIATEVVQLAWGPGSVTTPLPPLLERPLFVLAGRPVSGLRTLAMVVPVAVAAALAIAHRTSRIGLVVQAALQQPAAVGALGHDVARLRTLVFAAGAGLAALAGVIGGQLFVTEPAMALDIGNLLFLIVMLGGPGSLRGALLASLLVALVHTVAVGIDVPMGALFGLPPAAGQTGASAPARLLHAAWQQWQTTTVAQWAPVMPWLLLPLLLLRPRSHADRPVD